MTSGSRVETSYRELTDAEREEFLKDNHFGILSFAGDKPYVIPLSYIYRKGTFILGLQTPGRKMDYLQKSRNVSYTICKPTAETGFKEPCTGVMVEGKLEGVTDRAYYDLSLKPTVTGGATYRIKASKVGTRKWTEKAHERLSQVLTELEGAR